MRSQWRVHPGSAGLAFQLVELPLYGVKPADQVLARGHLAEGPRNAQLPAGQAKTSLGVAQLA